MYKIPFTSQIPPSTEALSQSKWAFLFPLARGLGCVEVSKCKIESIEDGSKIIEINGIPVRSLDYPVVKDVLASAEWPINLLLERPSKRELLPVLDK